MAAKLFIMKNILFKILIVAWFTLIFLVIANAVTAQTQTVPETTNSVSLSTQEDCWTVNYPQTVDWAIVEFRLNNRLVSIDARGMEDKKGKSVVVKPVMRKTDRAAIFVTYSMTGIIFTAMIEPQ